MPCLRQAEESLGKIATWGDPDEARERQGGVEPTMVPVGGHRLAAGPVQIAGEEEGGMTKGRDDL